MVNSQNIDQIKIKETWRSTSESKDKGTLILKEEFNKEGYKLKETAFGKNHLPQTETTWEYNGFGDCISQIISYVEKGEKLKFTFEYEYSRDRKIEISKYNPEKELVQEHFFKYGEKVEEKILFAGEINKIKIYNIRYEQLIYEESLANNFIKYYQYDDHGNLLEIREKRLNRPDKTIRYLNEYDRENRLIRQQRSNEVIEMEYNTENKMIERRFLRQGKIVQVLFFNYTYYK